MVYDDKIVDVLYTTLVTKMSELVNVELKSPFRINVANIRIDLMTEASGRRDGVINIPYGVDSQYVKVWSNYAPGKFLIKDWKKDIRDANGNSPYYVVYYTHGKIEVKALLRKLIEIDENTISETEQKKLLADFNDLTIDNSHYAVIKICSIEHSGDGWLTPDKTRIDIVHSTYIDYIGDDYNNIYPADSYDDEEFDNISDTDNNESDDEIKCNSLL